MRVTAKLLIVSLFFTLALMGCKNPCQEAIEEIEDEVRAFLIDSDPLTEGAQPCQDEICAWAAAALDQDNWPHFDCTSCDAAEIKLCNCYDDNAWMASFDGTYSTATPHYPASLYCLAKYYHQRSLCACTPCEAPNEVDSRKLEGTTREVCVRPDGTMWSIDGDCYEFNSAGRLELDENNKPIRVCDPNSTEGVIKEPILQQTDTCDAIADAFDCTAYDADFDGVPDQYDGSEPNDQDKSAKKVPENVECLWQPSSTDWQAWFTEPCSLYDNSMGGSCPFFIDYDGNSRYEDDDGDMVSNSCDNCPTVPNGFDCLLIPNDFDRFDICDATKDGVLTLNDLEQLSPGVLDNCLEVLNQSAPFLPYCDVNENGVVTLAELQKGDQSNADGDTAGDACDN